MRAVLKAYKQQFLLYYLALEIVYL